MEENNQEKLNQSMETEAVNEQQSELNNDTENAFEKAAENSGNLAVAELSQEEFEKILKKERSRGRRSGVIRTLTVIGLICIIVGILSQAVSKKSSSKVIDENTSKKLDYLWGRIANDFLWEEKVDKDKAVDAIYQSIFESLDDPYSTYYTKAEFDDLMESSGGEYSGIGAYISQNVETMEAYISRPMPDSPAEEAGLQPDDYIIEVDGEDVVGMDLNIIVSKIKGPEGTTVDLTIRHNNEGEPEVITVERRTIEVAMTEYEMLEDNIGYIWIYEFEGKTLSQFNSHYDELKSQGMEGLIIDLRDNPGGDLDVVCKLADKFLDEGTIVYTKDRAGKKRYEKSDAECEKLPIVIITNGNSASASEILTGSLKDRGVATVVGTNTFGKGIVQGLYQLADGTGYKLTEDEYYLPNDECIHGVGIAPDYEIEFDRDLYLEKEIDVQKDKAIEVMKEMLK